MSHESSWFVRSKQKRGESSQFVKTYGELVNARDLHDDANASHDER